MQEQFLEMKVSKAAVVRIKSPLSGCVLNVTQKPDKMVSLYSNSVVLVMTTLLVFDFLLLGNKSHSM